MFRIFFDDNYKRKKLYKSTRSTVMKEFYKKPFPNKKEFISDVDVIALDFETTGLDINDSDIVSIGLVKISQLGINLESCTHQLINTKSELSESSVVIHQITDTKSASGTNIETAIPNLLETLSGNVMLAHNAKVELGFINKMCQKLYGTDFVIPVIDTQYLAKRSLERKNQTYKPNELRLFNLRKSLNMPAYKAHNALMDAIATAELFLAMVNRISPKSNGRLSDFLS
ncbi:MAG: exonuclease domain-containing protein [Gammaproteobacteria bacterium]|nr:exonuclease domain-containing protein [Gammaproteobacteria bacterium]MDH5660198.1 exonuclease domain-containing protein [Gammaproteobacteria bacterium]